MYEIATVFHLRKWTKQ